jgi:hypothetical protein
VELITRQRKKRVVGTDHNKKGLSLLEVVDYANQCAALTDLLKMTFNLQKVEKNVDDGNFISCQEM